MGSFSAWHWLILAGIVWFVWRALFRRSGPASPPSAPASQPRHAKIRGNGRYAAEVVGESFYADAFESLYRAHNVRDREAESFGDAVLKLEDDNPHDKNAVGVYLEGVKVGHLSRKMAVEFREAIARDGIASHREFAVGARVYWGGPDAMHSVSLDLPLT